MLPFAQAPSAATTLSDMNETRCSASVSQTQSRKLREVLEIRPAVEEA